MSAAIAPTGEATLAQTVEVPFRVEVENASDFFDLPAVFRSLVDFSSESTQDGSGERKSPLIRVALQLPDEFLKLASAITFELHRLTVALKVPKPSSSPVRFDFIILADTQYSPCCVDEVAAKHISADVIVHFGRSCLSRAPHTLVIYAFGKFPIDVEYVQAKISAEASVSSVLVISDSVYMRAMATLEQSLRDAGHNNVRIATLHAVKEGVRHYVRMVPSENEIKGHTVVLIGPPSPFITHHGLVYNQHKLLHINPMTKECSALRSLLMKRYVLMQKARDAHIIGIIVGTLGIADYNKVIARIKELIQSRGKKYYTFALGKLNVPKLANFMEIDVFVLVSCPESSLIDSKEFYRPVVTPYELVQALDLSSSWTGEYRLEFEHVLEKMDAQVDGGIGVKPIDHCAEDSEQPYFSLVTGQYRTKTNVDNNAEIHSKIRDLTLYDQCIDVIMSPAGHQLAARSWQGLEAGTREQKTLEMSKGRFGNAARYEGEPSREN